MAGAFLFRCDATAEVALGHLKRCLSLAHALKERGAKIAFACFNDPAARYWVEKTDFERVWLPNPVNKGSDVSDCLSFAKEIGVDVVVFDSYSVDAAYFSRFEKAGLQTVYFEDEMITDWSVSGIINGLIGAEDLSYRAPFRMLGPEHLVLAPEYWERPIETVIEKTTLDLMVTMGGIDHYNLSSRLLAQMEQFDGRLKVHIVVGQYYENLTEIETAVKKTRHEVVVHKYPDTIQPIIRASDLAVSAGGITLYELASQGIPSVGVWLWENQRLNVERLGAVGAIIPLAYNDGDGFDNELGQIVMRLLKNKKERQNLAKTASAVVDGIGARRVASRLMELWGA